MEEKTTTPTATGSSSKDTLDDIKKDIKGGPESTEPSAEPTPPGPVEEPKKRRRRRKKKVEPPEPAPPEVTNMLTMLTNMGASISGNDKWLIKDPKELQVKADITNAFMMKYAPVVAEHSVEVAFAVMLFDYFGSRVDFKSMFKKKAPPEFLQYPDGETESPKEKVAPPVWQGPKKTEDESKKPPKSESPPLPTKKKGKKKGNGAK